MPVYVVAFFSFVLFFDVMNGSRCFFFLSNAGSLENTTRSVVLFSNYLRRGQTMTTIQYKLRGDAAKSTPTP